MATPETRSVELEVLTPSFDGDLGIVDNEENQVVAADTRELSAYCFDSDDETLVGIGSSRSADSSMVRHFDSSDRTLAGIGPVERAERAERAKLAELAGNSRQAEAPPESVMPHSEPPGPFIAADDDHDAPPRLPMQRGEPWLLALSAVLVAAAAGVLVRGVVPHAAAPRPRSSMAVASPPAANEASTRDAQFETAAVAPAAAPTSAVEPAISQAVDTQAVDTQAAEAAQLAAQPAAAQREQRSELAPRRAAPKSAFTEPLGSLDITSNPASNLVLDGRPLGRAPRVVQLASGPHTVLFVNPGRGRMSVTVNVRAGRTTSASANF